MVNGIDMKGTVSFKDSGKRKGIRFLSINMLPIKHPYTGERMYYAEISGDLSPYPYARYSLTVDPRDPLDGITVGDTYYSGEKLHEFYRKFYVAVRNRETERALDAL